MRNKWCTSLKLRNTLSNKLPFRSAPSLKLWSVGDLGVGWLVIVLGLLCIPYGTLFNRIPLGIGQMVIADNTETKPIEEIVVIGTRSEAKVFDLPYTISVINANDIQQRQLSRTTPEILSEEPAVMVQKTSIGQGSPYLRGFTGFRNVLLIDGIRMNNSVFREGPNQYWNTVDPFTIERLEILQGPASVLYGSDAIGGAVNVVTRNGKPARPQPDNAVLAGSARSGGSGKEDLFQPRLCYRYSSANSSNVVRAETKGMQTSKYNFIIGGSFKDFNNLKGGQHTGEQDKTGYQDNGADFKFEYLLSDNSTLTFAYQNVRQNDAWRTHRTVFGISWQDTTIGTDKKLFYDQNKEFSYFQYDRKNMGGFLERIKTSLSYQVQNETETRKRSNDKINRQGFEVRTAGFWIQAETEQTKIGRLIGGVEYYNDNVSSYRRNYLASGAIESIDIQGPVGDDASYGLSGVFVQDELKISPKLGITAGLRYTQAKANADKVKDPVSSAQIELSDDWNKTVGSVRALYHINDNFNIYGGVSEGFRAPNLSDLTRYDIAQSGQQEVPNLNLKPEQFISYELGLKNRSDKWQSQLSFFYTTVSDMIMRYPTGVMIGTNYEVQKANIGDGFIQGFEARTDYQLNHLWSLFGGAAYVKGEVDTYPTSALIKEREPMNKIQPLQGIAGIRYEKPKYWMEFWLKSADRQDHLSPEDKLDTQRIPPDGTPGYTVFNLRSGYNISDATRLSASVENITNRDYRIHGSGNNEPGMNIIVALDVRF